MGDNWDGQMLEDAWNDVWSGARGQTDFQAGNNQIAGADARRLSEDRRAQQGLISNYGGDYLGLTRAAAMGDAPSQAQDMLREGTGRAVSSAYGLAASAPGGGAQRAAAMNQAGWQAAQAQQQGARQAGQLRAQEMADARAQYGQGVQGVGNMMHQMTDADIRRATGNQDAAVSATTTNAGIAQTNAENDKGFINNLIGSLSDIRAKEDISTVQPAFTSTVQPMNQPPQTSDDAVVEQRQQRMLEDIRKQNASSATPQQQQSGGGFLAGLFSDERSKERIAELESALDRTTSALRDTEVEYPTLGLADNESGVKAKRVAPTDLVFDERTDQFRTPEQQYKYQDSLKRASKTDLPKNERLFVSEDESEFRTPGEQYDYQASLKDRDALAPVGEHVYRYKPEFAKMQGTDTGPRVGIMAQELEQSPSPELRSVVVDTPKGKAIDGPRALSANLGLTAGLDKRLREIEGQLGGDSATLGLRRDLGYR